MARHKRTKKSVEKYWWLNCQNPVLKSTMGELNLDLTLTGWAPSLEYIRDMTINVYVSRVRDKFLGAFGIFFFSIANLNIVLKYF